MQHDDNDNNDDDDNDNNDNVNDSEFVRMYYNKMKVRFYFDFFFLFSNDSLEIWCIHVTDVRYIFKSIYLLHRSFHLRGR